MTPTRRLAWLLLVGVPAALGGTRMPALLGAALGFDVVLVLVFLIEAFVRSRPQRRPTAERLHDARLVMGIDNLIRIRVHNPTATAYRTTVRDDAPSSWRLDPAECDVTVPAYGHREVRYAAVPDRRGEFAFGDIHLRYAGGLGLASATTRIAAAETVRAYPDVIGPRRYDLAARSGELRFLGIRRTRAGLGGGEFEKLREYVAGDDYGDIHWKATAKRQRPISRVYQQEKSQRVLICIDAGRMMAARLGRLTKLDHAINAALLLAYAALRMDDRVGLCVFADDVRSFVPAGRGTAQYRRLLEALYAVEPQLVFVDFRRLVEFVRVRVPRRSLIVLFSDLLDESHAMPLAEHAGMLARRHLPLCVTMPDPAVERIASQPVVESDDAWMRVAAADLSAEQAAVRLHLQKRGVNLVVAPPGELAVAAVNRYLELKARRLL